MFLPMLSGALLYASFPPLSLWPLVFAALAPLLLFLAREERFWRLFAGAFLFMLIFSFVFQRFLPDPLLAADGIFIWMGLPVAIFFLKKSRIPPFSFFLAAGGFVLFFIWAVARFSSLPSYMALFGIPLGTTPFAGLASWGGVVGLSAFVVCANVLLAFSFHAFLRKKASLFPLPLARSFVSAGAAVLLIGAGFFAGKALLAHSAQGQAALSVGIVGVGKDFDREAPAFDTGGRMPTEEEKGDARAYIASLLVPLRASLAAGTYDLVVLPEHMIDIKFPGSAYGQARETFGITNAGVLLEAYAGLAKEYRAHVLVNFAAIDEAGKKFNASLLITPEGEFRGMYQKRHLALGGEYWPFGTWVPVRTKQNLDEIARNGGAFFITESPTGQYARGEGPLAPLYLANGVPFGTPICLEGHVPYVQRAFKEAGARFLTHQSSNKWLGDPNDIYDALTDRLRRLEAIATGLPIMVSEKNGPAGIVYPDGTASYRFPVPEGVAFLAGVVRY
ncbi:MAG: nitrilase-related carbon-nitrogen hydrolase [bacterium]|nr:nitrilase-related carbon-nitrogen hydrolase [bacterium]